MNWWRDVYQGTTLLPLLLIVMMGCATGRIKVDYGIQSSHLTHVPARTAVLPCTRWPQQARYANLSLSNATSDEFKKLCERFDSFVLEGFKDQPYMRGFSPQSVQNLLNQVNQSQSIDEIANLWSHEKSDCAACSIPPAYYQTSIAPRASWRQWLKEFSKHVRNADALLLPFVTHAFHDTLNDRGLLIARRVAGVTLLLVDTDSGDLIWAGGRIAQATEQQLVGSKSDSPLSLPPWNQVTNRLLVDDIWKDFPGRILN